MVVSVANNTLALTVLTLSLQVHCGEISHI